MEPAIPFAQAAMTPEAVIARLRRQASADGRLGAGVPTAECDRLVEAAVCTLWATSRVKTFVGVLAMRDVREALGHYPTVAGPAATLAGDPG